MILIPMRFIKDGKASLWTIISSGTTSIPLTAPLGPVCRSHGFNARESRNESQGYYFELHQRRNSDYVDATFRSLRTIGATRFPINSIDRSIFSCGKPATLI